MPIILALLLLLPLSLAAQQSTILLNPGAETEEAVYLTQKLIHTLQKAFPAFQFLTTRHLNERLTHEATTSFANRIAPDLYISIHLNQSNYASLHVFTYIQDTTDYWPQKTTPLDFLPAKKAHIPQAQLSKTLGQALTTLLQKEFPKTPFITPLCSFPFKPLAGIQAPAIALELCLSEVTGWRPYKRNLEVCLINLINTYFFKDAV